MIRVQGSGWDKGLGFRGLGRVWGSHHPGIFHRLALAKILGECPSQTC